ncbi:SMI1/KNR4 family protein [Actinorugispora endophytica]|uniref:SMI1/KNR4 family protein n=1 Tax=Actinorugispora endophytica TaxID=1605990 RepID=UPI00105EB8B4|nr:SMI1/KNR4 family protein [Actinorugispora endophytica]
MSEKLVFDHVGFKERMIDLGVATSEEIQGCSDGEIAEMLSTKREVDVPDSYVKFMSHFGRRAGYLFRGTDFYYPSCLDFNDYAEEFSRDDDPGLVTRDRFFFSLHQGYELYFFESGNEDVWSYIEGDGRSNKIAESFPAYLEYSINFPNSHWNSLREQDRKNRELKKKCPPG